MVAGGKMVTDINDSGDGLGPTKLIVVGGTLYFLGQVPGVDRPDVVSLEVHGGIDFGR